jgi:hypothetical protein
MICVHSTIFWTETNIHLLPLHRDILYFNSTETKIHFLAKRQVASQVLTMDEAAHHSEVVFFLRPLISTKSWSDYHLCRARPGGLGKKA